MVNNDEIYKIETTWICFVLENDCLDLFDVHITVTS